MQFIITEPGRYQAGYVNDVWFLLKETGKPNEVEVLHPPTIPGFITLLDVELEPSRGFRQYLMDQTISKALMGSR